ncbi:MAG: cytochrome c [Gammaproteobacteria bacterium]|nr:cytochrome c [Gammaproteobacteria bacterium]
MKAIRISRLSILALLLVPAWVGASDVFKGKEVYARECMACHGAAGEGNMPGLPNFKESQVLFKTDNELTEIIRDGRGIMPSFGGLLTDDDIRDVTAYLRSFL